MKPAVSRIKSCTWSRPLYREKDQSGQMEFITFHMKFGGHLNPNNRWVRLAQLIPWEAYETEYAAKFPAKVGNLAKPFRMALGALLIKEMKNLADEELVEDIRENPYYQYLLGLEGFQDKALFEASSLVHFRKRISPEMLKEINEKIVKHQMEREAVGPEDMSDHDDGDDDPGSTASGTSEPMEPPESSPSPSGDTNKGKLLVDATCVPADIRFPTDLGLLNEAREKLEEIIDVLHASLKEGKKPRMRRPGGTSGVSHATASRDRR